MIHFVLVPVLLAAGLLAQTPTTTAHVQDSPVGGFGNIAPFGCLANGTAAAARSQILIPPQYLPIANSILRGLEAVGANSSGGNSTVTYASLKVTVSPTVASSLSANFAANLPSPVVVLNATNLTVSWTAGAWTAIPFTVVYNHDGVRGLVIDIQKVVSPAADAGHRTIHNARRADLPRMINTLGAVNSGANVSTTATVTTNSPLAMRLRWTGLSVPTVSTLKLGSDSLAPLAAQFRLGTGIVHTVQAEPGALFINLESVAFLSPPQALPPVQGRWWVNGVTLGLGILPASGEASTLLAIPNDPVLVGLRLTFQSLTSAPPFSTLRFTNATDCVINAVNA